MCKWDLTPVIGTYLYRHLVLPFFEFLAVKQVYDKTKLILGKFEIVKNMVDYVINIPKVLYPGSGIPVELNERSMVLKELEQLIQEIDSLHQLFDKDKVDAEVQQTRD